MHFLIAGSGGIRGLGFESTLEVGLPRVNMFGLAPCRRSPLDPRLDEQLERLEGRQKIDEIRPQNS